MCNPVYVRFPSSLVTCRTVGELSRVLGGPLSVLPGFDPHVSDDYCLCPIDVEGSALRNGFSVSRSIAHEEAGASADWVLSSTLPTEAPISIPPLVGEGAIAGQGDP